MCIRDSCQDGARVYGELITPGYLVNYVPESLKDQIPAENQNPLVFQFVDKVFIFNSEQSTDCLLYTSRCV